MRLIIKNTAGFHKFLHSNYNYNTNTIGNHQNHIYKTYKRYGIIAYIPND